MKSLKITIFFFFVVLLLAVQSIFVQIIYRAIQQQEDNQVRYQLETAQTIFETEFKTRQEYLAAFADTAAMDFALKQAFQEDMRSFLVALNNHRGRIDADIWLRDDRCVLRVKDTGVGLQTLSRGLGTGLSTLRERLKLAFGGEAQLTLTEVVPHGVCAEISFPGREVPA